MARVAKKRFVVACNGGLSPHTVIEPSSEFYVHEAKKVPLTILAPQKGRKRISGSDKHGMPWRGMPLPRKFSFVIKSQMRCDTRTPQLQTARYHSGTARNSKTHDHPQITELTSRNPTVGTLHAQTAL